MLTKNEFCTYIKNHIEMYDPELNDATVSLKKIEKNNGVHTGLLIQKKGTQSAPVIYLDSIYEDYRKGATMKECVDHLLDFYHTNADKISKNFDALNDKLGDYSSVQNFVSVRICDIERNPKFLENKPYTVFGDYAAYYAFDLPMLSTQEEQASVVITNDMLRKWEISKETLHEDAIKSVANENINFFSLDQYFHLIFKDDLNKYKISLAEENTLDPDLYCLTNRDKRYGAASILNTDALKTIGKMLGENFYILPSSVHECIILPETLASSVKELNEMLQSINDSEVAEEDQLSSYAQYFDQEKGMFYNPERQQKMEKNLNIAKNENAWLPKI